MGHHHSMDSALIVIDLQESFRRRRSWDAVSAPDIVARVARLVDAARSRGELVVWVLHSEPGSDTVFDPDSGFVHLMDGLEPLPGEPRVTKTSINAFTSTNLQQTLTREGVREVTICGIQTEQCCETTARVAHDLGFEVTFVTEATATFPIRHRSEPRSLAVEDIIERTEFALAGRFATIRTLDEVAPLPQTLAG
jgi:nicotinamidase-related amidase